MSSLSDPIILACLLLLIAGFGEGWAKPTKRTNILGEEFVCIVDYDLIEGFIFRVNYDATLIGMNRYEKTLKTLESMSSQCSIDGKIWCLIVGGVTPWSKHGYFRWYRGKSLFPPTSRHGIWQGDQDLTHSPRKYKQR